ncbi:nucleolar protein Nop52 family protein [Schizosaccharomyces cryophilus OY26]|uniref:Nucleolar protein Nop52 family protein n=1 Tax=Schizosaccharomyces cryophilus (strain OY26 / ATCC MYA-4695 / CBS 11777 / NBRC 106824 / NRRL Y48691) TaxID=653667 RepID=S9W2Y1_SCHCR|nr:nucleolar protein Nop52 family protein [Schizosaccharomyces cryophilus OY26]EPY52919.1 nucleolar protein Nop52 family protein [Schizosaccharomyces cryophilus OY26]
MSESSPFIKKLAANDRKTRDEALISLQKFLSRKKKFERLDFLKLWKGLFYCMWMSDKPLYQQKLADNLAGLVAIVHEENRMLFQATFWETMGREWPGIDILRTNKFYMLMRRFCAAAFLEIKAKSDSEDSLKQMVAKYNEMWMSVPFNPNNFSYPNGILFHLADIWTEELTKAFDEKVPKADWYLPFDSLRKTTKNTALKKTLPKRLERVAEYTTADESS